jgi:hypothetical protein
MWHCLSSTAAKKETGCQSRFKYHDYLSSQWAFRNGEEVSLVSASTGYAI